MTVARLCEGWHPRPVHGYVVALRYSSLTARPLSGVVAITPDALADSRSLAAFLLAFCRWLRALLGYQMANPMPTEPGFSTGGGGCVPPFARGRHPWRQFSVVGLFDPRHVSSSLREHAPAIHKVGAGGPVSG